MLQLVLNSWTHRGKCQEGKKEWDLLSLNTQIMESKFGFLEFMVLDGIGSGLEFMILGVLWEFQLP